MKLIMLYTIIAGFILFPILSYSENINTLIVGAWELERYDNILPADEPPAGMINLTYLFYNNGKSKHFAPGNEDKIVYGRNNKL